MVGAFARAGPVTVDAAVVLVVKLLVLVLVGYLKESSFSVKEVRYFLRRFKRFSAIKTNSSWQNLEFFGNLLEFFQKILAFPKKIVEISLGWLKKLYMSKSLFKMY